MSQYHTNLRNDQAFFNTLTDAPDRRPRMRMAALIAYITVPDRAEALRIGKALLESRLAACINILDGMESAYWWEGRIESARESVLLAKCSATRRDALTAKVRELHAYQVPCVVFWPLEAGNREYLDWIERECGDA